MKTNARTLLFSMLNIATFVVLFAFAASATAQVYDETYYSPTKNGQKNSSNYTGVQQQSVAVDDSLKEENVTVVLRGEEPEQATPKRVVTTVVYSDEDYYDYAYTARLRRFYRPMVGAGYYDDYYTNMYWYTYNPDYWGVSIYLGYTTGTGIVLTTTTTTTGIRTTTITTMPTTTIIPTMAVSTTTTMLGTATTTTTATTAARSTTATATTARHATSAQVAAPTAPWDVWHRKATPVIIITSE